MRIIMKKRRLWIDLNNIPEEDIVLEKEPISQSEKENQVSSKEPRESKAEVMDVEMLEEKFLLEETEIDSFRVMSSNRSLRSALIASERKQKESVAKIRDHISSLPQHKAQAHPFQPGDLVFAFDAKIYGENAAKIRAHKFRKAFVPLGIPREKVYFQTNYNLLIIEQSALEAVFEARGEKLSLEIVAASELLKEQLQDKTIKVTSQTDENYITKLSGKTAYISPLENEYYAFEFDSETEGKNASSNYALAVKHALSSLGMDPKKATSQGKNNLLIVERAALEVIFKQRNYEQLPVTCEAGPALVRKLKSSVRRIRIRSAISTPPHKTVTTTSQTTSDYADNSEKEQLIAEGSALETMSAKKVAIASQAEQPIALRDKIDQESPQTASISLETLQATVKQFQHCLDLCQKDQRMNKDLRLYAEGAFAYLAPISKQILSAFNLLPVREEIDIYKEVATAFANQLKQSYPLLYQTTLAPLIKELAFEGMSFLLFQEIR